MVCLPTCPDLVSDLTAPFAAPRGTGGGAAAYRLRMKASGWLYLAAACAAVFGLVVWWPTMIVGVFLSLGAYKQRAAEKQAAVRAQYAHTRRAA